MKLEQIKKIQNSLPNGNGIYIQYRKIDNDFNFSFHIEFENKQYNIWYCKIREQATISFFDKKETNPLKQLNEILRTENIKELETKINEIILI